MEDKLTRESKTNKKIIKKTILKTKQYLNFKNYASFKKNEKWSENEVLKSHKGTAQKLLQFDF